MPRPISASSIRTFLGRDWSGARDRKRAYWSERLERGSLAEALRVTDELRAWMQDRDPTWPSKEARDEDLETHRRVAATLARIAQATQQRSSASCDNEP